MTTKEDSRELEKINKRLDDMEKRLDAIEKVATDNARSVTLIYTNIAAMKSDTKARFDGQDKRIQGVEWKTHDNAQKHSKRVAAMDAHLMSTAKASNDAIRVLHAGMSDNRALMHKFDKALEKKIDDTAKTTNKDIAALRKMVAAIKK